MIPGDEKDAGELVVVAYPLLEDSATAVEDGNNTDFSSAEDAVDGLRLGRLGPLGTNNRDEDDNPMCETVADARDRERLLRAKLE